MMNALVGKNRTEEGAGASSNSAPEMEETMTDTRAADRENARSLLGIVAHSIYEAIKEIELGARQISKIAAKLRVLDDPSADALSDLGRDLYRHTSALHDEMKALFEEGTEDADD